MQPGYLPWLGFFELMARVDLFVIYDDVTYDKGSWRNRNRIRTPEGFCWMTVPVITKHKSGQAIKDVQIQNNTKWTKKHYKSLVQYYRKTPFFNKHLSFFEDLYSKDWDLLVNLNMTIIFYIKKFLGIKTEIVSSTQLESHGAKTERLVSICKNLNADTYISANGAKPYIQVEKFNAANIRLQFQNYKHPQYQQNFNRFVSHLSVIDLIFNFGEHSFDIIMSGASPDHS